MNKLFITLVGTSVTALVLAVGCGSWLFLKSWEEEKRLELQNRQLKASLEASRIRIENFCDYPAEALCNLEEQPNESVSGVMADIAHLTGTTPVPPRKDDSRESVPVPRARDVTANESPAAPAARQHSSAKAEQSFPEQNSSVKEAASQAAETALSRPSDGASPQEAASGQEETAVTAPSSGAALSEDSPASALPSSKTAVNASDGRLKKTWSSLSRTKNSMELRIAGEGRRLTAEGRLLREPLRYEVTLHGLWKIYDKHPDNELVKEMRISSGNADTIIVFPLAREPGLCKVSQEDARTIVIVIR